VETEARKGNLEQKARRAPRDLRGTRVQRAQQEPKVTLAIREGMALKGQRAKLGHEVPKETSALREAKALQARWDLQALWEVTGNSAFFKMFTKSRTVDGSR